MRILIPFLALAALTAQYPGAALQGAEKATEGTAVSYAVKVKRPQGEPTVGMDAAGRVLEEEKPEGRK